MNLVQEPLCMFALGFGQHSIHSLLRSHFPSAFCICSRISKYGLVDGGRRVARPREPLPKDLRRPYFAWLMGQPKTRSCLGGGVDLSQVGCTRAAGRCASRMRQQNTHHQEYLQGQAYLGGLVGSRYFRVMAVLNEGLHAALGRRAK